jgi:hypothetical protein
MDRTYIENEHIVDRYLSGELTVREAREFEKFCLDHPQILKAMAMPARLKARLARQPQENSETGVFQAIPSSTTHAALQAADEGFDDDEAAEWGRSAGAEKRNRMLAIGLSATLVAAVATAGVYGFRAHELKEELQQAQREKQATTMQAPASVQHYQVELQRNKPAQATVDAGFTQPPQLLELHINPGQAKYNVYQITIDKDDGTRVMQIRRIARDSNRELRVALNSSAFGPGEYLMRFDGYTWRGQTEQVGWVRLGLD